MRHLRRTSITALFGAGILAACTTEGMQSTEAFSVTITNNSPQVVTPPLVITHRPDFSIFTVGQAASDELTLQAETGDPSALAGKVGGMADVSAAVVGAGPIPPGESATITVTASRGAGRLAVTGMFATTNDAFFAIQGIRLPASGRRTVSAAVYDAGSEANNELCAFIPGPPCSGDSGNDNAPGEGTVQLHAGLTGTGDLDAALNWSSDAVQIAIAPVN